MLLAFLVEAVCCGVVWWLVWRGRIRSTSRSFLKVLVLKNTLHFYQVADLVVGTQERTQTTKALVPVLQMISNIADLRLASGSSGFAGVCLTHSLTAFDKLKSFYIGPALLLLTWSLTWLVHLAVARVACPSRPSSAPANAAIQAPPPAPSPAAAAAAAPSGGNKQPKQPAALATRVLRAEQRRAAALSTPTKHGPESGLPALSAALSPRLDAATANGTPLPASTTEASGAGVGAGAGAGAAGGLKHAVARLWSRRSIRYMAAVWSLMLMMYSSISKTTLQLLSCRRFGTESRNFYAPSVVCFAGYGGWQFPAFILLFLFVLPFPFIIVVVVHRTRARLGTAQVVAHRGSGGTAKSSATRATARGRSSTVTTATPPPRRFMLPYIMASEAARVFRPGLWWWESVLMLRRAVLIAVHAVVEDVYMRNFLLAICLVAMLVMHTMLRPYRHAWNNAAGTVMLALLVIISATVTMPDSSTYSSLHLLRGILLLLPFLLVLVAAVRKGTQLVRRYYKYRSFAPPPPEREGNAASKQSGTVSIALTNTNGHSKSSSNNNSSSQSGSKKGGRDVVNPLMR